MMNRELLIVDHVSKHFPLKGGRDIQAVREVSFRQRKGETLGVVGESGCGKSTLARLILHLVRPSAGEVYFAGEAIGALAPNALRRKRRDMQMIFQDPQASLDPRMRVGRLLEEPLVIHKLGTAAERRARISELLDLVGLPLNAVRRFPHEFSGGQRQRIAIARALALSPALIIADEPVSALDVSIQAQILNLLSELRRQLNLTYVVISHDLAVVHHISDTVAVMYLGAFVEYGDADLLFAHAAHPYTQALLASVPEVSGKRSDAAPLLGDPPSPDAPPTGCAFHPRCPAVRERCRIEAPPEIEIGSPARRHSVRCWLFA